MSTLFAIIVVALPFLDIASLIKAGAVFGFLPTLGLLLAAGVFGSWLVRHQGLAIGRSVQATVAAGRLPMLEAFDGACLLIAGGLFLFPGFVSDVFAILLLIPPVRLALRRFLGRRLREEAATTVVWTTGPDGFRRPMAGDTMGGGTMAGGTMAGGTMAGGTVIDADYQVVPTGDQPADASPRPAPPPALSRPTAPDTRDSRDGPAPTIVRSDDP